MSASPYKFFQPVDGMELPRFAGIPSFMRLPHLELNDQQINNVDFGLIGVPWDAGTTNRPGPRHGPRQMRDLSTMIRAMNGATRIKPFEIANFADLGDAPVNLNCFTCIKFYWYRSCPRKPYYSKWCCDSFSRPMGFNS